MVTTNANRREVALGDLSFSTGALVRLVSALRELDDGGLLVLRGRRPELGEDLSKWARLTGHTLVSTRRLESEHEWVVRKGEGRIGAERERPIGSRIWLYTNFDCNLRCDYCCVRSSPSAERRALGLATVQQIASEAPALGAEAFFVTGGEPMLLPDIGEVLAACCAALPTTLLTNGMLFTGSRLERLRSLPRDRLVLQISVDSPTPDLHDLHRGRGSWTKAMSGVRLARELGFRVRLAATVSSDEDEAAFSAFLDREGVPEHDRVIRRVALRGVAEGGVAVGVADLVPEVTITASGVYWHPVGADDTDFRIRERIFPLGDAVDAIRDRWKQEREHHDELASIFHCA